MYLKIIYPKPELSTYVDNFWVFESDFGVPVEDTRTIAPNGKAKFIYSFANGLSTIDLGKKTDYNEGDIFFIGIWDRPVTLSSKSRRTGTIGIELKPNAVHRFTKFSASSISNRIFSFSDVYGIIGKNLIEQLNNTFDVLKKIDLLQDFLVGILNQSKTQTTIIDYSVELITNTKGLVSLKELEQKTGYSKRYLDLLFKDNLGISPKTLNNITRFQSFYHLWANSDIPEFYKDNLHELYYDQAHFIKEFKKYTGYSPKAYALAKNDFGKIFYKK